MEPLQKLKDCVQNIANDPELFKETRYTLSPSLPMNLGSLSLGYSNGEPKIYLTKMVGQEGCIDWSLQSFVATWKKAIIQREFTPELVSLFQSITNEMMPGFAFDIGTFHWFLRPHAQDTKIGFALFGSRTFNPLASDAGSLKNLQFLAQNIGDMVPLSSFVFRRVSHNLEVGDVMADIFIMVSSNSSVFVQVCFKFIFNHDKLTESVINGISKNMNGVKSSNGFSANEQNVSKTNVSNGNAPKEHSDDASETQQLSNGNGGNYQEKDDCAKCTKKEFGISHLKYPSSSAWKWLIDNKLSLLSMSAAGLMLSATTNGNISRTLRVKL